MSDLIGSVWWMIVALGILVTFHEFGHYWVARRCNVHVLRFSVGFGKPLWLRRNRHGTEFAVAAIPLGGYVKMLDEAEGNVPASRLPYAFNRKPVLQRIAVVAAGPMANLILCVALLWAMFVIGKQDYAPIIGQADGIAASSGLRPGDRLLSVDGRNVATWTDASMALTAAAMDRHDPQLQIEDASGRLQVRDLALSRLPAGLDEGNVPGQAGLRWHFTIASARVSEVSAGSAADGIFRPGDLITAIDGQPVHSADQVQPLVQQLGTQEGGGMIEVDREGGRLALEVKPQRELDSDGKVIWRLGIAMSSSQRPAFDAVQRHGLFGAVPAALRETGRLTMDSLGMMRRMLTGAASLKNISGPVTIAQVANASAKRGVDWFLYFLALLSLSLAIINLLPIPVLDGGHLLYYFIELVKGSPLSANAMAVGQYFGLAILAGLMGLAFYNDILRLVT